MIEKTVVQTEASALSTSVVIGLMDHLWEVNDRLMTALWHPGHKLLTSDPFALIIKS